MLVFILHLRNLSLESIKVDNCKLFSILNLTVLSFINGTMGNSSVGINAKEV